ncbi:MAG: hypothetical protein ACRCYO_13575 [Bacteroidia bacterium]
MKLIPRKWHEVSIETYNTLQKMSAAHTSSSGNIDVGDLTDLESISLQRKMVDELIAKAVCLTNIDPEVIEALPMKELYKVNDLIKKPIPQKIREFFRLDGQLYQVCLNPTKENARRYMSVMNACKDNGVDNFHRIMFAISKPINNVVRRKEVPIPPDKIDSVVESFKRIPISTAQPVVVFFCNLSIKLINDSLEFSNRQMKEIQTLLQAEAASLKDMVGQ